MIIYHYDLSFNKISTLGAKNIFKVIKNKKHIYSFHLHYNNIGIYLFEIVQNLLFNRKREHSIKYRHYIY